MELKCVPAVLTSPVISLCLITDLIRSWSVCMEFGGLFLKRNEILQVEQCFEDAAPTVSPLGGCPRSHPPSCPIG